MLQLKYCQTRKVTCLVLGPRELVRLQLDPAVSLRVGCGCYTNFF